MTTGAAQFIFTLSPGIISPAIDSSEFLTGHALGPGSVGHEFRWCGQRDTLILETSVTKTLEGAGVCNMSAGRVCSRSVPIDKYSGDFEMGEEYAGGASTWS